MWKLRVVCSALLVAECRSGVSKDVDGLQAVDVPLDKWKRIHVDGRVTEILHGTHLDDMLRDSPDSARPPSLIYIHDGRAPDRAGTASMKDFMKASEEGQFGDRERLLIGKHDAGEVLHRTWFRITPERNLTHRFLRPMGDSQLPKVAFLPRKCNGWTEWCDPGGKERVVGGECYVEQCSDWKVIEPDSAGNWVEKVKELMAKEGDVELWHELSGMREQSQWLRSRDTATMREHIELLNTPRSLPRFTKKGFKLVEIPQDMQDLLVKFYLEHNDTARPEGWNSWGQTQINGHEVTTTIVDIQSHKRSEYYDRIVSWMKPRLEKWVGLELEQTSLYGMREYLHPATLRNHLDRADVLVVSVTFSVFQENFDHKKWPLEVISFDGNTWRMEHPQGTMMYYESATLQHGKPGKLPMGGKHVGLFLHYRPKLWMEQGYVEFKRIRTSRAVKVIRDDGRPKHKRQEAWPKHYYESERDPSVHADLEEGTYFIMDNKCNDPNDQRDDAALKRGLDPKLRQKWLQRKPLGEGLLNAAKAGNAAEVQKMLEAGADVNFADDNSWRALHEAARAGALEAVGVLLAAGADRAAKTNSGSTALHLAKTAHGSARSDLLQALSPMEL